MFFLVLLKGAKVPTHDIISFDYTCIRPVLDYCTPLYHHALHAYLSDDLERNKKRTFLIIISRPSIRWQPPIVHHEFS